MQNLFEQLAKHLDPKQITYTFKIYHDGKLIKEFKNQNTDFEPFKFLLRFQGNSVNYALKYDGYKVEEINELTNENRFWNPYSTI